MGKMCVYMSCFAELTWNKSLTAREYETNFVKFYMQALRKGISSETPTKVSKPASLCRVCRCSPAVLGRGKCSLFNAAKKNGKLYLKGWRLS